MALHRTSRSFRKYMRALEMERKEQEQQKSMKAAADVEKEREEMLAAMEEGEREQFFEDEKKKEWLKKRVRAKLNDVISTAPGWEKIEICWYQRTGSSVHFRVA